MKFRTEVHFQESTNKIENEDCVFSIGSCFATEIATLLSQGQLQTCNNPFGTIFNPYSISNAIHRIHDAENYAEEDLICFNETFISLDHHTDFDRNYAHLTLQSINEKLQEANDFLQKTNWVLITYGSAFIYEFLPKKKVVANCHKIPQKYFSKRLLSQTEIQQAIEETILHLNDIGQENLQILFTVSPVRHTKDGMVENQLSKSKLIMGIHETIAAFNNCHYLPIYEILMDDLRDYRFYKDDLVHPNSQAIQYIFEKFGNAFFSQETKHFLQQNMKIVQALNHKPSDENSPKYIEFREKLNEKIAEQQKKVHHKIFGFSIK